MPKSDVINKYRGPFVAAASVNLNDLAYIFTHTPNSTVSSKIINPWSHSLDADVNLLLQDTHPDALAALAAASTNQAVKDACAAYNAWSDANLPRRVPDGHHHHRDR